MLVLSDKMTLNAMTIMAEELGTLFESVPSLSAGIEDFSRAILDDNCLARATFSARKKAMMYLKRLYLLDPSQPLYRLFRRLWTTRPDARPLLALQFAWVNDSLVRDSAEYFLSLHPGDSITPEATAEWLRLKRGDRHSEKCARSISRNLNSSWYQAGFIDGIATRTRKAVVPQVENVVFALYLGVESGLSGHSLFTSPMAALLDSSESSLVALAEIAARQGLLRFKHIGDVMEVSFDGGMA